MMLHTTRLLQHCGSLAEGPWDLLQVGPHEGVVRVPSHRHIYDPFGSSSLTLFLPSIVVCCNCQGQKGIKLKGFTWEVRSRQ